MNRLLSFVLALLFSAGLATGQTRVPAALQKKFPSLKLQAKVATKRDNVQGSFYVQTMTISPSTVVEGASTQPIGAMEATMIIIAMDTKAKYVDRREVYGVYAAETIQIPAADRGEKREFDFKPSKTKYDAYRDTSNVGGAVYKWYIFGVRDAETKQLLHFETNCPALEKHTNAKPDSRDAFLKLATNAQFDTNFK